jgi:glycerol-3-phosphate dehydrogenase
MQTWDLLVIGGGINGAGIARDAAGRGLSVLLVEKGDFGAATSSASSKLIHGGLRYLEQYEFRLVAEALAEREVLLATAAHLVWPARFVMPHVPSLRPRWMIRAGLFLYAGLARELRHGFVYSDCRVDDARLVIANAIAARQLGAELRTRCACVSAKRADGGWRARLQDARGKQEVAARAIVNAAGPWAKRVLNETLGQPSTDNVRLVKGSHIVLPRLYDGEHAFILQNDDRRVVFMIPYYERYTLVGTTDVATDDAQDPRASDAEVEYLCRAAGRYLARAPTPEQVVWRYAGVRPLYDDGSSDPSAITRDYTLRVDADAGEAAVLTVYGGKITTYRRLAEHALERLHAFFPRLQPAWTAGTPLPGSEFGGRSREQFRAVLAARYRWCPEPVLHALFRRHGALVPQVLGDASAPGDLGERFTDGLTERELAYFVECEWARSADDVLWRRTKEGLQLDEAARERVAACIARYASAP